MELNLVSAYAFLLLKRKKGKFVFIAATQEKKEAAARLASSLILHVFCLINGQWLAS